jgi:hypothetical protein
MNNKVKFSALVHNLLLKTGPKNFDRQVYKNLIANIQASLQAAIKKIYNKLDLVKIEPSHVVSIVRTSNAREAQGDGPEDSNHDLHKTKH